MSRAAILAGAAVLAGLWVGLSHWAPDGAATGAFAQALEQIEGAKTITWKVTIYERDTSNDSKRTWLKPQIQQFAYKSPGLYRLVRLGEKGQVESIEITDASQRPQTQLTFYPEKKEAYRCELAFGLYDPLGPFEWVKKELREADLQWVEKRKTPAGKVNVFRHSFWDKSNGREWSYDFWIDQESKRLVEVQVPGADIFDPAKAPDRNNPPEANWSTATLPGRIEDAIVFNADMDKSLFRLEPPQGYALHGKQRPQVTEKEMIDYLGIVAAYNDKTFPEQVFPYIFSSDRLNKIWHKPEKERSPAEQKLLETDNRYQLAGLNMLPIGHFVADHTVANSFRYLGKGIKLGDKDRMVCWYKLKEAKDPRSYRVIYGDLSVKDVPPEALPLPVQP